MVKAGEIFHAEYNNYYGSKKRHYFFCVYSQEKDINNRLNEDVIGLMITSNSKMKKIIKRQNDYNVKIKLNATTSYVCCDKVFRFHKNEIDYVGNPLNVYEKRTIIRYYKKFFKESLRQLGEKDDTNFQKSKRRS